MKKIVIKIKAKLKNYYSVIKLWLIRHFSSQYKLDVEKINKRLKKVRFVHLMFNDKFNKSVVTFINDTFVSEEHLILCKQIHENNDITPMPSDLNVIQVTSYADVDFSCVEKIFCHALFDDEIMQLFYKKKALLQKTYWIMWGGDLYAPLGTLKYDYVKSHFKGYIGIADGEIDVVKQKYNPQNACFYTAPYIGTDTSLISVEKMQEIHNTKDPSKIVIQINNSCDTTTLEVFDYLYRFKDENIEVRTILGYGNMGIKEDVLKKGEEYFGEKFKPLMQMLSPNDYRRYFAETDILILNQNRQQGLGNCTFALSIGAKVFIKSTVSSYTHYLNRGCTVFDTTTIPTLTFKELIYLDASVKARNAEKLKASHEAAIKQWAEIYT